MAWVKKPPYIPGKDDPPIWYWYYDKEEDSVMATDITSSSWKLYAYSGLWWDEPIEPPIAPNKM